MKKIVLSLICVAGMGVALAQPQPVNPAQPTPTPAVAAPAASTPQSNAKLKMETVSHNFGTVIEGQIARYDFKFTNEGTEPLVLSNVQASCGCTTPKWPREPLAPGASAVITAEYNSNGRPGTFTKNIFVYSNGGDATLTITGIVSKEPEKPKSPVIIKG
ncbi:MAG: DUF1573 domain-containing protein [Bacteroidetes bacterium]|nr:DUF1573 domain-containing protein [Bacteroidota bacterium]